MVSAIALDFQARNERLLCTEYAIRTPWQQLHAPAIFRQSVAASHKSVVNKLSWQHDHDISAHDKQAGVLQYVSSALCASGVHASQRNGGFTSSEVIGACDPWETTPQTCHHVDTDVLDLNDPRAHWYCAGCHHD